MIECDTLFNKKKLVPAEKLEIRPAVYAIIIHQNKIVLMKTKSTGKYFFPGGAIEKGEMMIDALLREVKEETGLKIKAQDFFYFKETFFYYDPDDRAFQNYSFFYICEPLNFSLVKDEAVDDMESEKPRWVVLGDLQKKDFQGFGAEVFEKIKQILK